MDAKVESELFPEGVSTAFVEEMYSRFVDDPDSVDSSWQAFFGDLAGDARSLITAGRLAADPTASVQRRKDWRVPYDPDLVEALAPGYVSPRPLDRKKRKAVGEDEVRSATLDSIRALMLIRAYRVRGHLRAILDPLSLEERAYHPELDPGTYGFSEADMDRLIFIDHVLGLETATMREILEILQRTYCSTVGVEFMHIFQPEEKAWIQGKIEGREKEIQFTVEGKRAILQKLTEAEVFEQFLARKYIGTKRFGLDGAEAVIPALEGVIKTGGHLGLKEMVLGMAHRGRLNVLANVLQKPFQAIFHEFHGGSAHPEDVQGSGDVKYHLGTSADREFDSNLVHLSLTANPSHLEAVDPVVMGKARAKLTQRGDRYGNSVLSVLLHGDAAFAGQGLVAECLGMSGLKGYRAGGTIHFIINNQIGFTTAPSYSRSSPYPSDVGKMVQAPIFHVNGDDPEAVVYVTKIATEFRQTFKKDVVIDMFCYRRYGHNEGDEPAFTQPLMYQRIKHHPSTRQIYARRLVEEGVIAEGEAARMRAAFEEQLEQDFEAASAYKPNKADWLEGRWSGFGLPAGDRRAQTGVDLDTLHDIGHTLTAVPEGLEIHRTLKRILDAKARMFEEGANIDWATAEALAFGTLVKEGFRVRLSGQDSQRGTFSQRHAVWVDQNTEERYTPLKHVTADDLFEVHDSSLSEAGVLGFEYGFSLAEPNALVLWEAQFGDFANGAQVIIDQFIAPAERKWLRMSGLVLLLPHGYEGQGPEHSSARPERYLQLCAEDNIQVANCTTPANYFHILRRQMHRKFRKPLIIMTPKSLLRHKRAVSSLIDMGPGAQFHRVLVDHADLKDGSSIKLKPDDKITRVVLCTGKVYYDLVEERDKRKLTDTYLMRVEQLYPFPEESAMEILTRFPNMKTMVWCQEEPRNMGAWTFIMPYLENLLDKLKAGIGRPVYAGREASAATATGLADRHIQQQNALVDQALTA